MFTSLTKTAMPVIRYRTRDLTRLLPGTARSMRRMERMTGRSDDMMIIRGVNLFPAQIEEQILKSPGLTGHYQIILSREGRMDDVEVQVEARADFLAADAHHAEAQAVALRIKEAVGVTTRVRGCACPAASSGRWARQFGWWTDSGRRRDWRADELRDQSLSWAACHMRKMSTKSSASRR